MSQSGRDKKKLSQLEVSVKTLREVDDYLHPDIPRFHGSLHQDILGKVSTPSSTTRKVDRNLTLHSGSLRMNENGKSPEIIKSIALTKCQNKYIILSVR